MPTIQEEFNKLSPEELEGFYNRALRSDLLTKFSAKTKIIELEKNPDIRRSKQKELLIQLEITNIDEAFKTALSHEKLSEFADEIGSIELESNPIKKADLQKKLLLKLKDLEITKIDDLYDKALKQGKFKGLEADFSAINNSTNSTEKTAFLKRELLRKAGALPENYFFVELKPGIIPELKRLSTTEYITKELAKTEKDYSKSINHFLKEFVQKLQEDPVLQKDPLVKKLLTNLGSLNEICALANKIDQQLTAALAEENTAKRAQIMSEILATNAPKLQELYSTFISLHPDITKLYDHLKETNPTFRDFCTNFNKLAGSEGRDCPSHTIMVVQRFPRYQLLLKEIITETPTEKFRDSSNPLVTSYGQIIETGSNINKAKAAYEETHKDSTDIDDAIRDYTATAERTKNGFRIKVSDIQYAATGEQLNATGIMQQAMVIKGYSYREEFRERSGKQDRKKVTIYDEQQRAILKIKYGHDKHGREHMSICCGKKEIQRFANDNIRYKGKKVIPQIVAQQGEITKILAGRKLTKEILNGEDGEKIKTILTEELQKEFPGYTFDINMRQDEREHPNCLKIKVRDAQGKEILVIKQDKNLGFRVIDGSCCDPNKQFFNPIEFNEQAMKAVTIAMDSTHPKTGKTHRYHVTTGSSMDLTASAKESKATYRQGVIADLTARLATSWAETFSLPQVQAKHAAMSPHHETSTPKRGISPVVTPPPTVRETIPHAKPLVHVSLPLQQVASQRPQPPKLKSSSPPKLKSGSPPKLSGISPIVTPSPAVRKTIAHAKPLVHDSPPLQQVASHSQHTQLPKIPPKPKVRSLQLKMPPEMAEPPKILSSASPLPQARTIGSQRQIESRTHVEPPTRPPLRLSSPKAPVRLGEISSREDIERLRTSLKILKNNPKLCKELVQALIHAPFPLSPRDLTSLSKPEDKQSRAEWIATYIEANKSNPHIDKETIAGLRREIVEIHKSKDAHPTRDPQHPSPKRGDLRA